MISYDLTKLGPHAFEHLVNMLAIRVLGPGLSVLGPGADGGRDGFFDGSAPYPSQTEHWSGVWYIQSKFHAPHLSKDPQKWLLDQIKQEIRQFNDSSTRRQWPDNWIVATNIDPSGVATTGCFDAAKAQVKASRSKLHNRFHIWGGAKILSLLADNKNIADKFRHFLTPGDVLSELILALRSTHASVDRVVRHLVVSQFEEHQFTKLEQAGTELDTRPGIQKLFMDVPIHDPDHKYIGLAMQSLVSATSKCHSPDNETPTGKNWEIWSTHPLRAKAWFARGGPGRGKSTIGQYFSQIQRAALIIQANQTKFPFPMKPNLRIAVEDVAAIARKDGIFPITPRLPLQIDLKDYSAWHGKKPQENSSGILSYISEKLTKSLEQLVPPSLLLELISERSWFVAFDGLDEVPHDAKDDVAKEIRRFLEDVCVSKRADVFALCTSRPQGYSGQFSELECATVDLINLNISQALACARPILGIGRSDQEADQAYKRLSDASGSSAIQQLMTTPLQAHIMAIIVRDGGRPPERRWQLFKKFYDVIKRREANKNFPDIRLTKILREDDRLLKTIHNRLGFYLQARSEVSDGAEASFGREEFQALVRGAVLSLLETDIEETVETLMRATTERLVLVSTPETGSHIRFDVRQLQEFFAAEFIYEGVNSDQLQQRLEIIAGDSHWREVVQFCISALVEQDRTGDVTIASQVLVGVDTDHTDHHKRRINRKLCRGATIAARLLSEGVLEQDRRARQRFWSSLDPLLATAHIPDIATLSQTAQPNSRKWLIDYLHIALRERAPTETVGAALTLALMLKDNDAHAEISTYLENAPVDYSILVLGYILAHPVRRPNDDYYNVKAPLWLIRLSFKLACNFPWLRALSSTAPWLMEYIADQWQRTKSLEFTEGQPSEKLGKAERYVIKQLSSGRIYGSHRRKGARSVKSHDGLLKGFRRKLDWLDVISNEVPQNSVPHDEFRTRTGIFWVPSTVNYYIRKPTAESLRQAAKELLKERDLLQLTVLSDFIYCLPIAVERAVIPQLEMLAIIDDASYECLLRNRKLEDHYIPEPLFEVDIDIRKLKSKDEWDQLSNRYPIAAASALAQTIFNSSTKGLITGRWQPGRNELLELWETHPGIAEKQFPIAGLLVQDSLNCSLDRVRKALRMSAQATRISKHPGPEVYYLHQGDLARHPIALTLPADKEVLTYAAFNLLNILFMRQSGLWRHQPQGDIDKQIEKWTDEYISDALIVSEIALDTNTCTDVRLAAALILSLHSQRENLNVSGIDHLSKILNDLDNRNTLLRWSHFISKVIEEAHTSDNQKVIELVSTILDKGKISIWFEEAFSALFNGWRERSCAPVSTSGEHVFSRWDEVC